ncbi:MAG: hypothetical protein HETSPECPRED_005521 [Heterodermia speciosa]|uniref:Uncharacterized protein n=1 Tax=Heterodermia speciosa TaxID=116794 RepID=A0A8H3FLR4_9LECA|nr:MAG: hypothetical protein HETSPECPRED_005521 [Heterodermia speciosa]
MMGIANQHNDQDQREPPPPPTPLEFPRLRAPALDDQSPLATDEITKLFSSVPRHGPSISYISALHIQVTYDVDLADLLPTDFLPPPAWLAESTPADAANTSNTKLNNGVPTPDHAAFYARAKELLLSNDAAFAFLQRKLQPSAGPTTRIAHFRKFWDHLLGMAEFWDTSLDKYAPVQESHRATLRSISRSPLRSLSKSPFRKRSRSPRRGSSRPRSPGSPVQETYTGRRIGCGLNMPVHYREDAVCAFVETVAWAFRCRVERPKIEPKLQMGGMVLPIMQTASVYRTPKESQRARKGVVEGPLMAIQCRNMHSFRKEGENEGEARGEVLDFLKETGLALLIAQKRMREGKTEQTTWKGKWWAEQRRWGGGTGKQISLVEAASQSKSARSNEDVKRVPEKYIKLHPPTSTWEKNVEYMQIGKDRKAQYDDIYIVSSINHHVSILHFHVAKQYNDFITNLGTTSPGSSDGSAQQPWSVLSVQRSRWYDLLKAEDRTEAMRGIWGVMGWLMRDTQSQETEDVRMGGTEG